MREECSHIIRYPEASLHAAYVAPVILVVQEREREREFSSAYLSSKFQCADAEQFQEMQL